MPVVVAAQLNIRESDLKGAGKTKPDMPISHWEALGKPLMPDGDKFAETSQYYRAADLVLYLANPMQEAGGSAEELVAPYLTYGEIPLFVKVAKLRGGAPKKLLTLGYVPHAQALHEKFEEPPPHIVRIYTKEERDLADMPEGSKRKQSPTDRDTKPPAQPKQEPKKRAAKDVDIPEQMKTPF